MVALRSWTPVELQRSLEQQTAVTIPMAKDIRWKLGALFLLLSWLVILLSLWQSMHVYLPRNHSNSRKWLCLIRETPTHLHIQLLSSLVLIGYTFASTMVFDISPLKTTIDYDGTKTNQPYHLAWIYAMGWGPILLIMMCKSPRGFREKTKM